MPAIDTCDLLNADHQKVEMLFSKYQSADNASKPELAQQICMELIVHATLVEEIFYPAFRQLANDDNIVAEAEKEHQEAKDLTTEIEDSEARDPLMSALQQAIERHVREERMEMFPKARKAQGVDLLELGSRLHARKAELMANVQKF